MRWDNNSRYIIVSHMQRRTTSGKTKELLQMCIDRIDELERANQSFSNSWELMMDQIPGIVEQHVLEGKPVFKEIEK